MPYKISGTISEEARIIVLDESDWSIESNTVISGGGNYEIDVVSGTKTLVSRIVGGQTIGYGSVAAAFYAPAGPRTLDNPNAYGTSANDYFGYSVAISGNNCIVGAFYEDDADGDSSGKAYIFNVSTGALLQTLDNPNAYDTSDADYF